MIKIRDFFLTRPQLALPILAAVYLSVTALYPAFNRPLATTYCLNTALDDRIGFSAPWILPYISWYVFIPTVGLSLMFRDKKQYTITFSTMIGGLIISYLTYSFFQTVVPRPDIIVDGLFSRIVQLIYSIDQPYNAFPSIHVLATYALMLGAAKARNIHIAAKAAIWAVGLVIILSTVFIKQHVVLDILGGIVLAQILFSLLTHLTNTLLSLAPKQRAERMYPL